MIAVGFENILAADQAIDDGQKGIDAIHDQEHHVKRVGCDQDEFDQEEHQDKGDGYGPHIAGKTAGPDAEIVKTKERHGEGGGVEEIVGYEGRLVVIHDPQPNQGRKTVPRGDAVDTVHKIEGIDDSRGGEDGQRPKPPWPGGEFQLHQQQQNGGHLKNKAKPEWHLLQIIEETDHTDEYQTCKEPRELKT